MGKYVDGFLIPVAKDKLGEYKELAQKASEIWKELGALEYRECVGDDLETEDMVSFKSSANAAAEEIVIFAWVVYESKADRDRINAAIMEDPRMKEMMNPDSPVFDYKRMAYGGFKMLVEA